VLISAACTRAHTSSVHDLILNSHGSVRDLIGLEFEPISPASDADVLPLVQYGRLKSSVIIILV